jgi:hypothetical protein
MNSFSDLRFVIGLFFSIIGALLIIYYFLFSINREVENLYCGVLFLIFGCIFLAINKKSSKDIVNN